MVLDTNLQINEWNTEDGVAFFVLKLQSRTFIFMIVTRSGYRMIDLINSISVLVMVLSKITFRQKATRLGFNFAKKINPYIENCLRR